jgi:hypothetical protein
LDFGFAMDNPAYYSGEQSIFVKLWDWSLGVKQSPVVNSISCFLSKHNIAGYSGKNGEWSYFKHSKLGILKRRLIENCQGNMGLLLDTSWPLVYFCVPYVKRLWRIACILHQFESHASLCNRWKLGNCNILAGDGTKLRKRSMPTYTNKFGSDCH